MRLDTKKGEKVKVTEQTKNNGYDSHKRDVAQFLEIEKEYTVEKLDVGSWMTYVYLEEVPNMCFNSVCLVNC